MAEEKKGEADAALKGGDDAPATLERDMWASEVAALLRLMEPEQVRAVHHFVLALKAGAVQPAFFTLIADALCSGERIYIPRNRRMG